MQDMQDALQRCGQLTHTRPEVAIEIAGQLLEEPRLPPEWRLSAMVCRGSAEFFLGRGGAAHATLDSVMDLLNSDALPVSARAQATFSAAILLTQSDRGLEAAELLGTAQRMALHDGDMRLQATVLSALAYLRAIDFDDLEGALPYFRQAYALLSVQKDATARERVVSAYDLGCVLLLLGRHDEADAMFEVAETGALGIPALVFVGARIAGHRAEILRIRGDTAGAEMQSQAALRRARKVGDAPGQTSTLRYLARALMDQGRAQEALGPAEDAVRISEAGSMMLERRESLYLLAEVHGALGNRAQAADVAARALRFDRSAERRRTAAHLARLQANAADELRQEQIQIRREAARSHLMRQIVVGVLALVALSASVLLLRTRRQKQRLSVLSETDPLTGLDNRRAADPGLQALTRDGRRAALLLIDIDAFKSVNDRFGHDVGDGVLVATARALCEACRKDDVVARWGGEEFLVGRGDVSQAEAFALADRLRRAVESLRVDDGRGGFLPLTVSVGVASLPIFPDDTPRWQLSIRAADRALYVAKRAGRNAWGGLWGLDAGRGVDLDSALDNPLHAFHRGWWAIGGNRPMDWSGAHSEPSGDLRDMPVRPEQAIHH